MAQLRRKLEPNPAPAAVAHHRARHGLPLPAQRGRVAPGQTKGQHLPRERLAVTGEGAGGAPVREGDGPDDAGGGLG